MIERRMAERKALALSIEYDLGAADETGERTYHAEAQDMCNEGLGMLTDHPLKKGAVLRLNCPESGPWEQIPLFAEVAWAAPYAGGSQFRAGLRFLR